MIVTDVADLKDWQNNTDERLIEAVVDAAESQHPEADLSLRSLKLLDPINVSTCPLCSEPEFTVRDSKTGFTVPMCRMCINAVRRQSLSHAQYTSEICWDCSITKDSLGLINGAIHHTIPFDDEVADDGSVRIGFNPLIAAGLVDLTLDVLTWG